MKDLRKMDKTLLVVVIIFTIFGLVMIFSASSASTILRYQTESTRFFTKQLIALVISFFLGFIILFIPTKKYNFWSYIAVIGTFLFLLLVLVKGKVTNNAQSWIKVGFMQIQPSEFAKTIMIVFMACFYDMLYSRKVKNISVYFIPLAVAFAFFILIVLQPDIGSAAIFVVIVGCIFITVPFIKKNLSKIIKLLLIAGVLALGVIYIKSDSLFTAERMSRFNFKNPCSRYREDTGYQVCNSLISVSNGGLLGVGLGKSTQKYMYLPESHTDFIFPIICEELGSLTGCIVILGYAFVLIRIYKIAKSADNLRTSIIAYGTFWYLTTHILINLLGVLALIPLTGVPLPFLSYGGSYTLNVVLMIFICERCAIENNKNKLHREMAQISA